MYLNLCLCNKSYWTGAYRIAGLTSVHFRKILRLLSGGWVVKGKGGEEGALQGRKGSEQSGAGLC